MFNFSIAHVERDTTLETHCTSLNCLLHSELRFFYISGQQRGGGGGGVDSG
jgi:hypothetical protein